LPKSKSKRKERSDSQFSPAKQEIVKTLLLRGFTDEEVATVVGVHRTTLFNWRDRHPEFFAAVKEAKDQADEKVERCLYERATGYVLKEVTKVKNALGNVVKETITMKEIPPDVTAQIYWLKNRQKDRWKDKWEIDIGDGRVQVNILSFRDSQKRLKPAGPPINLIERQQEKKAKDG
jgi:transposase-like protein